MLTRCLLTRPTLMQMVNRGSTKGAEEMERLNKGEVLSMLKFGADRCASRKTTRVVTEHRNRGLEGLAGDSGAC